MRMRVLLSSVPYGVERILDAPSAISNSSSTGSREMITSVAPNCRAESALPASTSMATIRIDPGHGVLMHEHHLRKRPDSPVGMDNLPEP